MQLEPTHQQLGYHYRLVGAVSHLTSECNLVMAMRDTEYADKIDIAAATILLAAIKQVLDDTWIE